jgi:aryl-alcohol dehydrogenase-like predicted oxidoreductase
MINQYNNIKNCSLKISPVSLGLMYVKDKKDIKNIYTKAIEYGVNYFDTASNYENGESEKILGEIITPSNRSKVIIGTKAFFPTGDSPLEKGLGKKHLLTTVDNSLKRLKTDYLDIFYLHRFDEETPIEETLNTIKTLLDSGKILYWGVSSFSPSKLMKVYYTAQLLNIPTPIIGQYPYNLFNRDIDIRFKEIFEDLNLSIINYYPLSQGLLSGKYIDSTPNNSRALDFEKVKTMWDFTPEKIAISKNFYKFAEKLNLSPVGLAYKWCAENKMICSTLTSVNNEKQLDELFSFFSIKIDDSIKNELNQIFKI